MDIRQSLWRGERVELRAKRTSDIEHFVNDAFPDDMRLYGDGFVVHPASPEFLAERNEKALEYPKGDDSSLAIESHAGELVGSISAINCNSQAGDFEYGVAIFSAHHLKGYAKDAVKTLLRYYFEERRYHRATAKVYSFNQNSIQLQESLGFKQEGCLREAVFTKGQRYDTLLFGMTAHEFWKKWGKTQ